MQANREHCSSSFRTTRQYHPISFLFLYNRLRLLFLESFFPFAIVLPSHFSSSCSFPTNIVLLNQDILLLLISFSLSPSLSLSLPLPHTHNSLPSLFVAHFLLLFFCTSSRSLYFPYAASMACFMRLPICAGDLDTITPASSSAAILGGEREKE